MITRALFSLPRRTLFSSSFSSTSLLYRSTLSLSSSFSSSSLLSHSFHCFSSLPSSSIHMSSSSSPSDPSSSPPSTTSSDPSSSTSSSSLSSTPIQRRIRIYTKTGDKGTSSLFTMERRSKNDAIFHTLGDVDELNANIGMAIEYLSDIISNTNTTTTTDNNNNNNNPDPHSSPSSLTLRCQLEEIQSRLFDIGSHIATPRSSASSNQITLTEFSSTNISDLESWIDSMDATLPPLKNFILPSGGGHLSSSLHISRAICRRAERGVVGIKEMNGDIDDGVVKYLNRLSDYLFIAARYSAVIIAKKTETIWKKASRRNKQKEEAAAAAEKENK